MASKKTVKKPEAGQDISSNTRRSVAKKPGNAFIGTFRTVENHKQNLYGCAFNQYLNWPTTPVAAAVGGTRICLYEFPANEPTIIPIKAVNFKFEYDEELFTVAWCSLPENMHRVVFGGETGTMYVMDPVRMEIERHLKGCGDNVNDIRASPINPTLIVAASKDLSVRIFDIRNSACLLICGGMEMVPVANTLSADWTPDGKKILSCGFDHRVSGWDLSSERIQDHLKRCAEAINEGKEPEAHSEYNARDISVQHHGDVLNLKDYCLIINQPTNLISDLHFDYVDCIRPIEAGEENKRLYYLTKGCGDERKIYCWRFGTYDGSKENQTPGEPSTTHALMFAKDVDEGFAWFSKFAIDPLRKWIVVGGGDGTLQFLSLCDDKKEEAIFSLGLSDSVIRQVDFCAEGRIIFVVGDGGLACRLDRSEPSAGQKDIWAKI